MEKLNKGEKPLPELEISNLSRDMLADLLRLYAKLYVALDGFWYLTLRDRISNEAALACDIQVWEEICRYEMKNITQQLDIHGKDVAALMRAIQLTPWFLHMQHKIDIKNSNKVTFTITRCPTLEALEREGEGREKEICGIVEPVVLKCYASFFSPDIEVKCLKMPPRKSKDEYCCQWEFTCDK
ncbi:DUF6125 family protein [Chloroflexota bacterium]